MSLFKILLPSVLLILLPIFASASVNPNYAPQPCDGGAWSHPATADEAASIPVAPGQVSPIIVGVTPLCPRDALAGINSLVGRSKNELFAISTKVNTADKYHIAKLKNEFAVCAAKFAKAFSSTYGIQLTVTSAWRSGQDNINVGGAPGSNHLEGVSLDIEPNPKTEANFNLMRDFAKANKSLGVCFAQPIFQDKKDLPHMTLAGVSGNEGDSCKRNQGITEPCPESNFSLLAPIVGTPPTPQQLVQGGTDQQQYMNYWQQQQDCGPNYMRVVTSYGSSSCLPLQVSGLPQTNSQYSYLQAQPMQTGVPGISGIGGSGFSSGIASLLSGLIPSTSNTSNTPSKNSTMNQTVYPPIIYPSSIQNQTDSNTTSKPKTATSAIDLIHDIAYPTSTKTTTTSVVTVVSIGSVIVSPGGTQYSISNPVQATVSPLPGTHVVLPQQTVQQTFIPPDLNKAPIQTYSPQQTLSPGTTMLNNMKQILVAILDILRPLRNSIQSAPPTNSTLPTLR